MAMTFTRASRILASTLAAVVLAVALSPARVHANDTQRLIVDAGLNLGLWQAQVAIFDAPFTEPSQIGYANNAYAAIEMIRERLLPPFEDLDLQSVLDDIERYPERTEDRPARQRAIAVQQIHGLLHARLSLLYLSTVGIYAAPNCDGAFLDVGYHLGRAQMAAFAGDGATLANARSMLLQAVRSGLDAARNTGCGFNLEAVWNGLGIDRARTFVDYQGLVEPIRNTAVVASARLDLDDPWSPTDPRRDTAPPPIDDPAGILGSWRFESGERTTFRHDAERIVGTWHDLRPELLALGYAEGMESFRLDAVGEGRYLGQTAVRGSDGVFRWRDVRVEVSGDTAIFSDLFDGGRARYEARRER
jgi:hypothetical protein